jgi:hypothetical protein
MAGMRFICVEVMRHKIKHLAARWRSGIFSAPRSGARAGGGGLRSIMMRDNDNKMLVIASVGKNQTSLISSNTTTHAAHEKSFTPV